MVPLSRCSKTQNHTDECYDANKTAGEQAYYWDPEKSSRDKFVALGLGTESQYNFSALASKILGQAQPNQFQSSNQTGYIWGSIYKDADDGNGGKTYSGAQVLNTSGENFTMDGVTYKVGNNANSAMARSYRLSEESSVLGDLYTWYAATAESIEYNNIDPEGVTTASDTICPSGWTMPKNNANKDGGEYGVLFGQYTKENGDPLSNDEESIKIAMKYPLSVAYTGWIGYASGIHGSPLNRVNYWSKTRSGTKFTVYDMRIYTYQGINFNFSPLHTQNTAYGAAVRCLLKSE